MFSSYFIHGEGNIQTFVKTDNVFAICFGDVSYTFQSAACHYQYRYDSLIDLIQVSTLVTMFQTNEYCVMISKKTQLCADAEILIVGFSLDAGNESGNTWDLFLVCDKEALGTNTN